MLRGASVTPLLARLPEWDTTPVSHLTLRNVTTVNGIVKDLNDPDQSPILSGCSYCSNCSMLRLLSSTGSSSVRGRRCRSCRRERTLRCLWSAMTSLWRSLAGEHLDPQLSQPSRQVASAQLFARKFLWSLSLGVSLSPSFLSYGHLLYFF